MALDRKCKVACDALADVLTFIAARGRLDQLGLRASGVSVLLGALFVALTGEGTAAERQLGIGLTGLHFNNN
jgi:hypothetical protein